MDIHIDLKNVSVSLPIYDISHRSLKKSLVAAATGGIISTKRTSRHVEVNALRDVNLSLQRGDRLALIGHNGAGKTTLLRVLAGILEPSAGHASIAGDIAPVFDIGLGMDPDATGRENVYLRSLFLPNHISYSDDFVEDILAFSDLGEFAEMPIRTYSAGMVARLQFAITTAIRPDILLLDEGIGAGDAAFVRKAQIRLDQMMEKSGILVLASHSEGLVRSMCTTGVLMEKGEIVYTGDVDAVLAEYESRTSPS